MSEPKYKVGQEVQTSDGDRHTVEEIRYRYVVKRTHAVPVPGVRPGLGYLNSYDEEDLAPYVRPLAIGDRVRVGLDDQPWKILAVDDLYAWIRSEWGGSHKTAAISILGRIPTEAGQ